MPKAEAARNRALDINPSVRANAFNMFLTPETADLFDFSSYGYIVDAIDSVTGKIELVKRAKAAGIPIISAMGAGNKLNPAGFKTADIYETSVCPLARVMRKELRKIGIESLKVVYSQEEPVNTARERRSESPDRAECRAVPGSTAFTPAACGLIIAGEVVKDLCGING
jgi:tRNA A37 threonylcarbamoyladenosine dehydratase